MNAGTYIDVTLQYGELPIPRLSDRIRQYRARNPYLCLMSYEHASERNISVALELRMLPFKQDR